ncbi:hypothetical protein TRICI_000619 [Trichomonascus ciferrii]|uniref:YAG7-like dimerisation domain-containing protein n=1 Tax=Trichomonascus ciferrii TaxID=44093 RepID=A0A642VC36_9ASCO|nr:hypothetical protein TRICI_000619 [Trichomonascus ciferrii]
MDQSKGLSKRALKRLQKQQQQQQEPGTEPVLANGDKEDEETEENDELFEYLQKRIRNLTKRKQRLDKYQEMADDPQAKGQLNADQLHALNNKESVEAPLKDLTELLALYKSQQAKNEKKARAKQAQHQKEMEKKVQAAKQEGIEVGTDKLNLTIKFLRAASFKRQLINEIPKEESAGFEYLLQLVYNGDETSLKAIESLYNGDDAPVAENTITYAQIKKIAQTPPEKFFEKDEPKQDAEPQQQEQPQQESSLQTISFLQDEVNDDDSSLQQQPTQQQDQDQDQNQDQQQPSQQKDTNAPASKPKKPFYRKNKKKNTNNNPNGNGNGQPQKQKKEPQQATK